MAMASISSGGQPCMVDNVTEFEIRGEIFLRPSIMTPCLTWLIERFSKRSGLF